MAKAYDIKEFAEGGLRERPVNYIQVAKSILDSYPLDLAHGVQKDAIQNGWDAIAKRTPAHISKNWKFEFELIENPDGSVLLSLTDFGTHGLTGMMTSKDITEDQEPPEEERWARWESLAFAKSSEGSLGARGQGKMILVAASKSSAIVYDSVRENGSYRVGTTQATMRGCPIVHFEESAGRKKIKEMTGLEPIDHVGTRVVIIDPVEDLVSSIKTGQFLGFIEETWWPLIQKFEARILLKHSGNTYQAKIPTFFPITKELPETKVSKTWIKENVKFNFERNVYVIKRLCFACDLENEVPETQRGIACFRGGMKVDSVQFPDKIYRNKVYGYVEFDEKVDKLLRVIEMPNHYTFRNTGIWKKIQDLIELELEAFGNKKLGLGIDTRELEKTKRNAAENKAISILRNITKEWPFAKTGKGAGGGGGTDTPHLKEIGLRLSNLTFPNAGNVPRLNWEDTLKDFYITIFNRSDKDLNLIFKGEILSGDRVILELDNQKLKVEAGSEKITSDGYSFKVSKKIFPSQGEYRMKFILTNADSKTREDELTRRFWVESEPELKGPFDVKPVDFSELKKPELQKIEWHLYSEGDGKQTLYYNTNHPAYEHNDETEEKLTQYLSEVFCFGALQLLVRQAENGEVDRTKSKELPFDLDKLLSKDSRVVYSELTRAMGSIRADIYSST